MPGNRPEAKMAKILPGLAVHKISGTIGGTTFQNWRGILVARSKPTPTNVMTPRQTVIRALMTLVSRAWRDELTKGLRTAWNQRAKNYPWLDVFGREVKMSGENLYIKQNMVLLDHGLTRQDTPVPDVVPPELTDLSVKDTSGKLELKYDGLPAAVITAQAPFLDVSVAGGFLTAQVDVSTINESYASTLALPAGRKHQKSDFRHVFYISDLPAVEPPEPSTIAVAPPTEQIRNVVISVRRYNKYGNFTAPMLLEAIVTGE